MISEAQFQKELQLIIQNAIREDIGPGDYSSLACIPSNATGKAKLLVKDEGIIAGATDNILSINNVQESDAGVYTAVLTNSAGSTISSGASLSIIS